MPFSQMICSHCYPLIRSCAIVVLTAVLVWQASFSVQKYLRHDTTIVVQTVTENKQWFLAVSICPYQNPADLSKAARGEKIEEEDFFLYYEHHHSRG